MWVKDVWLGDFLIFFKIVLSDTREGISINVLVTTFVFMKVFHPYCRVNRDVIQHLYLPSSCS